METKDCILTRRSIRRYDDKPIPRATIEQIVSLASYAPSWKNAQPTRYTIVTDRSVIEQIANEAVLGYTHNAGILLNCAALAIQSLVNKRSGYERDGSFSTGQGTHWESFDAGISAQTFCLAAQDLGIGTCIMGIFDEKKVAGIIALPDAQTVSALIPMGYPAESPKAPVRKGIEDLMRYIGEE